MGENEDRILASIHSERKGAALEVIDKTLGYSHNWEVIKFETLFDIVWRRLCDTSLISAITRLLAFDHSYPIIMNCSTNNISCSGIPA